MFTGIIEDLGKVLKIDKYSDASKMLIRSVLSDDLSIGDSIAVNGVCLTVVEIKENMFSVDVVKETLKLTNLNVIKQKNQVNLERCMKIGDRINGHIVSGHIDGTAKIISKNKYESQTDLVVDINENLLKYCIYKGSICLDGISLTIANLDDTKIGLAIIPYTIQNTTLKLKDVGDIMNVETDMFAKYAENMYLGEK